MITTYMANLILRAITKHEPFSFPSLWLSLHNGDPGDAGDHEIPASADYGRLQITTAQWDDPADKASKNNAIKQWANLPGITIRYIGLWDAEEDGNFLDYEPYTKRIPVGESFRIEIGKLSISLVE